jgi:hypothetical protein
MSKGDGGGGVGVDVVQLKRLTTLQDWITLVLGWDEESRM